MLWGSTGHGKRRDGRPMRRGEGVSCKGVLRMAIVASLVAGTIGIEVNPRVGGGGRQIVLRPKHTEGRKLTGKFLHITDLHPDQFYTPGQSEENACHKPIAHKKRKGALGKPDFPPANPDIGEFGAPLTGCDSPMSLINATFKWINDNLRDEIDFVIWTGDSSRHDNDESRPRTQDEVWGMNDLMAKKMMEVFGDPDTIDDDDPDNNTIIPVVPTIGNNDIMPHNVMLGGPTPTIRNYLNAWRDFIPSTQYHIFGRGAYFWKQVIPGRAPFGKNPGHGGLAIVSLNTMYFFTSNAAVDGCDKPGEPGTLQMEWLKAQLDLMRREHMKAIFIGHVPPARVKNMDGDGWRKKLWDDTCWRKYMLYTRQYRDVIVSGIYGHMNVDHFLLENTNKALPDRKAVIEEGVHVQEEKYTVYAASDYLQSIRASLAKVPPLTHTGRKKKPGKGKGGLDKKLGEKYVVSLVPPSVIPNYFPALRVFSYNTTGILLPGDGAVPRAIILDQPAEPAKNVKKDKKKKKKKKDPKGPEVPPSPPKSALPGPAYAPQTFSLTSYTQLYANLTKWNNGGERKYEVLYNTSDDKNGYGNIFKDGLFVKNWVRLARGMVDARRLRPKSEDDGDDYEDMDEGEWTKFAEGAGEVPLKAGMEETAQKGKGKKGHGKDRIWRVFLSRAFVGAVPEDRLRDL